MSTFTPAPIELDYLDTPRGLLTSDGMQYAVREAELVQWAARVFDIVPLRKVLGETHSLSTFQGSLLLWLVPVLAMVVELPWIILVLVVAYPVFRIILAPVTAAPILAIAKILNLIPAQAIYYIAFLSIVSQSGRISVVVVSLVYFVLARLGVLDRIFRVPIERLGSWFYHLHLQDVTLRSRILNIAASNGIVLDGAEERNLNIFSWKA